MRVLTALVFVSFVLSTPVQTPNPARTLHLHDNSDWWSVLRHDGSDAGLLAEEREFAPNNFQVAGVTLADNLLRNATGRLGKAVIVERGDGAGGRSQICYHLSGHDRQAFLVFEEGEVQFTFYLFTGGPAWRGIQYCADSTAVHRDLITGSGLHLGQTRREVMATLGKPTTQHPDELIYSFLIERKASEDDLEKAHRQHPEMTKEALEETYGSYYLTSRVHAKFSNGTLSYLAVSKAETT